MTENCRYEIAFQSKADQPRTGHTDTLSCACDLDLDPMTLIYELKLDILKIYWHTKNEVSRSKYSKIRARIDRQTDTNRRM